MIIKKIICKIKGHTIVDAGSCPFTGLSYSTCNGCMKTIPEKLKI